MPIDLTQTDTITLGGQVFPVKGSAQGNSMSEFEVGLKVGASKYDTRTQSFYATLGDFSGGMGYRRWDIRDDKDNHFWDYVPGESAADTRRPNHVTLGPLSHFTQLGGPQSFINTPSNPSIVAANAYWLHGLGPVLYKTPDGENFTEAAGGRLPLNSIILVPDTKQFQTGYIAFFKDEIQISSDTVRWQFVRNSFAIKVGERNIGNGDEARYVFLSIDDGIYWDNKVVAGQQAIIFGLLSTDPFVGALGVDWNVADPNDGQIIAQPISNLRDIQFVGIEKAPWGEPSVYFLGGAPNGSSLYVLDFFARKCYPIVIGLELGLKDAKIWNARIVCTDGWNVFIYDTAQQVVSSIGFPRQDGLPPSLIRNGALMQQRYMVPHDQYLYTVAADYNHNISMVFCHNGQGWHRMGAELGGFAVQHGAAAAYQMTGHRKFHSFGYSNNGFPGVYTFDIPSLSNIPLYGLDAFEASGSLITGWTDGGFSDIFGVLLKMHIDALHLSATETVKVQYQLDNNEDMDWVPLVDTSGVPAVFTDTVQTLYFSQTSPFTGIEFRTVRFRITLARGADIHKTPELRGLVMTYIKKPFFRSTWTFTIDIDRMLEAENAFTVDGNPATIGNVWAKLQSLWNTQPLLTLTIPSVELGPLYVLMNDMPITFDDFRAAVGGHGQVMVKCLEPINRA